ncbi:MAG: 4-hydroxybenzoate polyprenyl transferase [Benniella sp.]|nr:MAG: 4-hydroxybenzoate polyprenyl transferase [Benniella sp.]
MLSSAGSSLWHKAALNAMRTRLYSVGVLHRSTSHQLFSAHVAAVRISTSPSIQIRNLSLRSLRAGMNKGVLARSTKLLFAHHHQQRHEQYAMVDNNESTQLYSSKAAAPSLTTPGTWLDRMPKSIQPYLYLTRIDKPIGTWLLFWPCAWGITMASYGAHLPLTSTLYMIGLFGTGAIIMRGAGCTINDLWDRDIDKKVERTKVRPLASGVITPSQAIAFLGLQLGAGLAVLTQLNLYSILLGASSLSLVVTYPAMKRITYWPQVVLGLAFNWGALLGSSAMLGAANWSVALPLYASGICWTLVYDTIYAHQDKKDDIKIGVKSTALRFGEKTPEFLAAFSTGMISMLALAGYMNDQGPLFYTLSVAGAAAHLGWQLRSVDYNSPTDCWSKFASNKWTGALVFSGVAGDYLLQLAQIA